MINQKKLILILLLISSLNLFGYTGVSKLQLCADNKQPSQIYPSYILCIDDEQIVSKKAFDIYGDNNVEYISKSNKFKSIVSKIVDNKTIWELTTNDDFIYKYSEVLNKEYVLDTIIDPLSNTLNISKENTIVSFTYDKDNNKLSQIAINANGSTTYHTISTGSLVNSNNANIYEKYLTKTYTFDVSTKLKKETTFGSDIETRETKYEHTIANNIYTIKSVNSLNQLTTKVYDDTNNLIKSIDQNNLITTYEYNGTNISKKTEPSGAITTYTTSTDNLIENSTIKFTIISENRPTAIEYYNNHSLIRRELESFDKRYIVKNFYYDEDQKLTSYSLPHFKSEEEVLIENIDTSECKIDSTSSLEYTYDVLGNIKKIVDTSLNKIVSITYDKLNRVIQRDITTIDDEGNESIKSIYYIYDRAENGEGKLAYIRGDNYKKEFYYDELSRVKAIKEYINNKTFVTQYIYTADGKIDKITSPDGFEILYEYTDHGYLSAVKIPQSRNNELNIDTVKEKLEKNLSDELSFYKEYMNLSAKANFYTRKKAIYESLSTKYASIDTDIQTQLTEIAKLLDETVTLLNKNVAEYKKVLDSYKMIREKYLISTATKDNNEDNYKWLNEIFKKQSEDYLTLSTTYLDIASKALEGIITDPALLDNELNDNKQQATYYKDIADSTVQHASTYASLASNYWSKYMDIKHGNTNLENKAYSGMFDNSEYKYLYKVISKNAFDKVLSDIYGNGIVNKYEYDSQGNLTKEQMGYYGSSDIKNITYVYDTNNRVIKLNNITKNYTRSFAYDSSDRVVSATNIGDDYYTNLVYSYNDDISSYLSPIKSYKKSETINEVEKSYYSIDKHFKYEVTDDTIKYRNFIYADDKLIATYILEDTENFIVSSHNYLHQDIFGKVDTITSEATLTEKEYNFRPLKEMSDISWKDLTDSYYDEYLGYVDNNSTISSTLTSLYDSEGVLISTEEPINTTKTWYKPIESTDEMGIYVYNGTEWIQVGTTDTTTATGSINTDSLDTLNDVYCFYGDSATIDVNGKKIAYTCDESQTWQLGGSFEGVFSIMDLATTYIDAKEGSRVSVASDNGEFSGTKTFTKRLNCWIDDTYSYVITDSFANIQTKDMAIGSRAFYPDGNSGYYTLKMTDMPTFGKKWTYTISDSNNLLSLNLNHMEYGEYVHLTSLDKYFSHQSSSDYWLDSTGTNLLAKDFTTLATLSSIDLNTIAYYPNSIGALNTVKMLSVPNIGNKWTYSVNSLTDVINLDIDHMDYGEYSYVSVEDKYFIHNTSNSKDFWTDNNSGDGQENATFIFTKGSRTQLPLVTHSLVALTKELGEENRYTTKGIDYSNSEKVFKQWFYYSLSSVNGLTDAPTCDTSPDKCTDISWKYAMYKGDLIKRDSNNDWIKVSTGEKWTEFKDLRSGSIYTGSYDHYVFWRHDACYWTNWRDHTYIAHYPENKNNGAYSCYRIGSQYVNIRWKWN